MRSTDDRLLTQPYIAMQNLTRGNEAQASAAASCVTDSQSGRPGDASFALAAFQHPEISAAINAAVIGVLQRYSNGQPTAVAQGDKPGILKPIVRNNLFIITVAWSILGMFLLYAAVEAGSIEGRISIFTIYGIVQVTLAVFTLIVTTKQVKKVRKRSITLGYLMQGWMALVLCFAGTYLFFQNAHSLGLIVWGTDKREQSVRAPHCPRA
jgi:hypothetical protein